MTPTGRGSLARPWPGPRLTLRPGAVVRAGRPGDGRNIRQAKIVSLVLVVRRTARTLAATNPTAHAVGSLSPGLLSPDLAVGGRGETTRSR
jgi:hypothetical protein